MSHFIAFVIGFAVAWAVRERRIANLRILAGFPPRHLPWRPDLKGRWVPESKEDGR